MFGTTSSIITITLLHRCGVAELRLHQFRSGKIALVLNDASILNKCCVTHNPFRNNLPSQPGSVVGGIGEQASASGAVAEQLAQSSVRKNISAVGMDMQLDSLLLRQLLERRGDIAAVA